MRRFSRHVAFSLVELLVVIAIVALLIAILLPSMGVARQTAVRTKCLANLNSWMTAQVNHVADRSGRLTPQAPWDIFTIYSTSYNASWQAYIETPWQPQNNRWSGMGLLYRRDYLRDMRIAWCPAESSPNIGYQTTSGWRSDPWASGNGRWMAGGYIQRVEFNQTRLEQHRSGSAFYADQFTRSTYYYPGFNGDPVRYHHQTGYNVVYLDGSGAFLRDAAGEIAALGVAANAWANQESVWSQRMDR